MISTSSTGTGVFKNFPKLMTDGTHVVLFVDTGEGTVIHKKKLVGTWLVGDHRAEWVMSKFKDTDEAITLCSKES